MFVESRSDTGESEAEAEEAEPRREAATNTRVPDSPGQETVQRSDPSWNQRPGPPKFPGTRDTPAPW